MSIAPSTQHPFPERPHTMSTRTTRRLAAVALALTLPLSGTAVAQADPTSAEFSIGSSNPSVAAADHDRDSSSIPTKKFKVNQKDIELLNALRKSDELGQLPDNIDSITLDPKLRMQGFDATGAPV